MVRKIFWLFVFVITANVAIAGTIRFEVTNEDKGDFTELSEDVSGEDNSDGNLTMGGYISYIPSARESDDTRYQFTLTSDAYSPSGENKARYFAVDGDRPYAGYLGVGWHVYHRLNIIETNRININSVSHLEIDLGVIGPTAGQQEIQNYFHKRIAATEYAGWQDQVENRYGGVFRFDQNLRFKVSLIKNFLDFELAPHVSAVAGNFVSYSAIGGNLRVGRIISDMGPARFNYFSGSDVPTDNAGTWNWNIFFGWERRKMHENYTLEGATLITQKQTVTMEDQVRELQAGVRLNISSLLLDFVLVERGIEFSTQADKQQFLRFGLGYRY